MEKRETERVELPLTALKNGESGIITSIKAGRGRGRGERLSLIHISEPTRPY